MLGDKLDYLHSGQITVDYIIFSIDVILFNLNIFYFIIDLDRVSL